MLALGAKGAATNEAAPTPGGAVPRSEGPSGPAGAGTHFDPSREPIRGDPVEIEVTWETDKGVVFHRAEELVWNESSGAAMTRGSWLYNGSMSAEGSWRPRATESWLR
jgi:hypothetical protein